MKNDIWTEEQLLTAREEYLKPRSAREFMKWISEHPNYDLVMSASSMYPFDYTSNDHPVNIKDFSFAKIAELQSIDLKQFLYGTLEDYKDVSAITQDGTTDQVNMDPSSLNSPEQLFKDEYNFNRETHFFQGATLSSEYRRGICDQVKDLFEFDEGEVTLAYQPPAAIEPRHVDFLGTMWRNLIQTDTSIADRLYDPITKNVHGYYAIRALIAATDYFPGHVFGFEDKFWTGWKQGDIITFDWAHHTHFTSNVSFTPRVFLKVSGLTQDPNHWIFQNINDQKITHI